MKFSKSSQKSTTVDGEFTLFFDAVYMTFFRNENNNKIILHLYYCLTVTNYLKGMFVIPFYPNRVKIFLIFNIRQLYINTSNQMLHILGMFNLFFRSKGTFNGLNNCFMKTVLIDHYLVFPPASFSMAQRHDLFIQRHVILPTCSATSFFIIYT